MPAAMRNPLVDMPKNLKRICPASVNTTIVMNDSIVARFTILALSPSSMPDVIVRNTGMVPRGFVRVKNDVRQMNAYGSRFVSSIFQKLLMRGVLQFLRIRHSWECGGRV